MKANNDQGCGKLGNAKVGYILIEMQKQSPRGILKNFAKFPAK